MGAAGDVEKQAVGCVDRHQRSVAVAPVGGLFLDVTGCTHLFGGERAMLDDILSRFFHQGFDVRAGLAATP
ncbi:MAG: hypothetical protein E5W94_34875, partial [Mesorhizobium sp.]